MITNTGKDIIAKYLIGQTPAYASHIALGCGPRPLVSGSALGDYSTQSDLDFEMFRVPITSRGYVTELVNGLEVSKVVFTAEIPGEQRYEISEVGVYSAKSNPSAIGRDSRTIYTFTESEQWEYHTASLAVGLGDTIIQPLYTSSANTGIINPALAPAGVGAPFRTNSSNAVFSDIRLLHQERGRFLSTVTLVPGDMSQLIEETSGEWFVKPQDGPTEANYYGKHIHLTDINVDFSRNSPSDELRLAFSVVNKDAADYSVKDPSRVKIMLQFDSSDSADQANPNYAKMQVETIDLTQNRYHVVSQKLSDLFKSSGFTWNDVNLVKIYVSVYDTVGGVDVLSDDYYVLLDGLRLENTSSDNPLYGLTGYSVVRTDNGYPIIKESNTSNVVEFRFGLDVI